MGITTPPDTSWNRLGTGISATTSLLAQITQQAADAVAAALAAAASSNASALQAANAAISALNAEAAALAAAAAAAAAAVSAGAADASAAAAAAALAAIVAAGTQVKVAQDGGPQSDVHVLNFEAPLFIDVVDDVASITVQRPSREDLGITVGALLFEEEETGTITFGPSGMLYRVQSEAAIWLRIYATAADRTADAARVRTDDPTTNILFEAILDSELDLVLYNPVPLANADDPVANDLYYSVVGLTANFGSLAEVAHDTPVQGGSNVNLTAHVPTDPASSGWAAWESTSAARYHIPSPGTEGIDGIVPGAATAIIGRSDVNFAHRKTRVWADILREGVDRIATQGSVCVFVPETVIGSYGNDDYVRAGFIRDDASHVNVTFERVAVGGAVTPLGSGTVIAMALGGSLRVIVDIDTIAGTLKISTAVAGTGASETLRESIAIPSGLDDGAHRRVGVFATLNSGYSFAIQKFTVEEAAESAEPSFDVTLTRLALEKDA